MDKEEIRKELYALLDEKFCVSDDELRGGSAQVCTDLGLDSLDVIELVEYFENKHNISIPDSDAAGVADMTVDQLVDFVCEAVTKYKKA